MLPLRAVALAGSLLFASCGQCLWIERRPANVQVAGGRTVDLEAMERQFGALEGEDAAELLLRLEALAVAGAYHGGGGREAQVIRLAFRGREQRGEVALAFGGEQAEAFAVRGQHDAAGAEARPSPSAHLGEHRHTSEGRGQPERERPIAAVGDHHLG